MNAKKVIGVLRSKGGSGEHHSAVLVARNLAGKTLICAKNNGYFSYFANEISLNEITQNHQNKLLFVIADWFEAYDLFKLSNIDNLILSVGTNTAGNVLDNINEVSSICESIYISVNDNVQSSIERAIAVARQANSAIKIEFIVWTSKIIKGTEVHTANILSRKGLRDLDLRIDR